mmetsp:Transcript_3019/g.6893  ORF Transcript_3019/g.6893 Transcript_3019/m.6893 type:complete len:232 (+) Transcript_3019:38-733(+)|eukprot:s6648_g3.t1
MVARVRSAALLAVAVLAWPRGLGDGFALPGAVPGRGRRAWMAFGVVAEMGVEAATAEEDGSPLFVVDETNLLTPSTEKYLDRLLKKLEDDTGLKLRVICPPRDLQTDRDAFSDYLRPISKKLGTDQSTVVILAEERFQKRTGRPLPLMTVQVGFRLQERFQYRLTNDFLLSVADKYGFPPTVDKVGPDLAIQDATKNVAACLFGLSDDATKRFLRFVPEEQVTKILQKHGL